MKTTDFLIELQTEELPAGYIEPALNQLVEKHQKVCEEKRIAYKKIKAFGVPRALMILIKAVAIKQAVGDTEILGPAKNIAFDKDGKPTQQAVGFAKRYNVSLKNLKIKSIPKGEYIYCIKRLDCKPSKAILKDSLLNIIKEIKLPKTMRWDDSNTLFARPIRKISIMEGPVVASYFRRTEKSAVIFDPILRKKKIKAQLELAAKKIGARPYIDEGLLNEVTNMVESPFAFLGSFNREYLLLPKEVLIASMSKYQRLFAVAKDRQLLPNFVAIIDGKKKKVSKIKSNYEGVLGARLKDSLFFFREDLKVSLFEKKERLKELIFQKDLGNMYEKIFRIKDLSLVIARKIDLESKKIPILERAALLSKADLTTQMVKEFPSLQGVMGKEYALKNGEEKGVACAIEEHYLPQAIDDPLPETDIGTIIAIADRVDSLVGLLGIGLEATGSFDPYGIRRISQGIIRLVVEKNIRVSLNELLESAIEFLKNKIKLNREKLKEILIGYLQERIENLIDPENLSPVGLREAILSIGFDDLVDTFNRFKMLFKISKQEEFLKAAKVVERTNNILKGAKKELEKVLGVDPGRFVEELERSLWSTYSQNEEKIKQLIDEKRYVEATKLYGKAFYNIIHEFFDRVLVNVEEQAIRLNRLAIMKAINKLYTERVADLSRLPQIVV